MKHQNKILNFLRSLLLRLALGNRTYRYMCRTLSQDPRLRHCRLADIVVRKDAREVRIEADWLKDLCKIVSADLTPPVVQPYDELFLYKVAERDAILKGVLSCRTRNYSQTKARTN